MAKSPQPAPATEQARTDVLEGISRNVTLIGGIIAAVVAANTALTTCSNESVNRHALFRKAVESEELFWRERFNDYLGVFSKDLRPEERKARLYALSAIAQREVPQFKEYDLGLLGSGDEQKELASRRLNALRLRLNEALDQAQSSDPTLAQERQQESFAAAEATTIRPRVGGEVSDEAQEVTAARIVGLGGTGGVTYRPQTLSAGDPKGWDIDTFWCAGGGSSSETANYTTGLKIAQKLSAAAEAGNEIAPGVRLGRIRLLSLPDARQGGIYPLRGEGIQLRAEPREEQASNALVSLLGRPRDLLLVPSDMRTNWYLSFFACGAGTPTTPRPVGVTENVAS